MSLIFDSVFFFFVVPITSVVITSDPMLAGPIIEGTSISLICTVEMGALLVASDWQLFDLEVTFFRDDSKIITFVNSTTLAYTHQIISFSGDDSGNYSCTAIARPHSSSGFINGSNSVSNILKVTTGKVKRL